MVPPRVLRQFLPDPPVLQFCYPAPPNDKLVQFGVTIASITLVDKADSTITLYNNPNALNPSVPAGPGEFMHLNGVFEPLVTASVPQGVYTAATVKVGACGFTTITVDSSGAMGQSS